MRKTSTSRSVMAGCFECWGSEAHWFGQNAQGVAARHHDATGHATWADIAMSVFYGEDKEGASAGTTEDREEER